MTLIEFISKFYILLYEERYVTVHYYLVLQYLYLSRAHHSIDMLGGFLALRYTVICCYVCFDSGVRDYWCLELPVKTKRLIMYLFFRKGAIFSKRS